MTILITGASGLLGRALMTALQDDQPIGTAYSRAKPPLLQLDLTQPAELTALLNRLRPRVIIHAAAERRPDIGEKHPEHVLALNSTATGFLAQEAARIGAWLLYISTDYVFDGTAPPYAIDAKPNPINFYGRSKLQGEQALWAHTQNAAVLRLPILYGSVEHWGESAVTVLYPLLDRPHATVDHYAIRYPTLVDDVAQVCRALCQRVYQQHPITGTLHWSGAEAFTKYQMLAVMADLRGRSMAHITPEITPTDTTPRPRDCQLDSSVLDQLGIGTRTPFRVAIAKILKEHCHPAA